MCLVVKLESITSTRCYLIWRRHHVLPDDDDAHPFLGIMILAIEIILGEGYTKPAKKKMGDSLIYNFLNIKNR
jgi:hypothetical protein